MIHNCIRFTKNVFFKPNFLRVRTYLCSEIIALPINRWLHLVFKYVLLYCVKKSFFVYIYNIYPELWCYALRQIQAFKSYFDIKTWHIRHLYKKFILRILLVVVSITNKIKAYQNLNYLHFIYFYNYNIPVVLLIILIGIYNFEWLLISKISWCNWTLTWILILWLLYLLLSII